MTQTTTKKERCEFCRYYNPQTTAVGECRRHAPVLVELYNDGLTTFIGKRPPDRWLDHRWPDAINMFEWCGDFSRKSIESEDPKDKEGGET